MQVYVELSSGITFRLSFQNKQQPSLNFFFPNLLNFSSNSVVFISFAMEEEDFQPPEICVVGNETTWRMDLPENHG